MPQPTRNCYVSIPFGMKYDASRRREVDFDEVYHRLVQPAVEAAGLLCFRSDTLISRGSIQKAVLSAILSSDVMIADISLPNANVFYELGVRHGVRPRTTFLIAATGTRLTFNVSNQQYISYPLELDSEPDAARFRDRLSTLLREALTRSEVDSPVYELFPELKKVEIPPSLLRPREPRRLDSQELRSELLGLRNQPGDTRLVDLRRIEDRLRNAPGVEPALWIDLLLAYRDASAWAEVVRLTEDLPSEVRSSPVVVQQGAMALNRRRQPGDRARAAALLSEFIQQTGGNSEAFGLLGRVYKDMYEETRDRADLDRAIEAYRRGFELDPSDYYPGVNLATLLHFKGDAESKVQLESLIPFLRDVLTVKAARGGVGYWEIATLLELACLARDWDEAEKLVSETRLRAPAPWMVETTARNLRMTAERLDADDRRRLEHLIGLLVARGAPGASHA